MRFISTRNQNANVTFENAVLNCMPSDGGLYIPFETPDLRRWILYTNKDTKFSSIAGSLTSAFLKEEFSPIICETVAEKSFTFSPDFKKLDENLYLLDLSTGPTGSHKDFGISFLVNALETILTLKNGNALFLDVTYGELGASLAKAIRGKKHLKAVLVYPKGKCRGLEKEDLIENGGNILALEFDGTEKAAHNLLRIVFNDEDFIKENKITVANTANFGRLLSQMYFYPYAFSRLKEETGSNIYYAMESGNFSNLYSGLYAWKVALPMGGLITASTPELAMNPEGNCEITDSIVPMDRRESCDPVSPSNMERLEDFFHNNAFMLENLVFVADVSEKETVEAAQKLFNKYGIFSDKGTARSYAAAMKRSDLTGDDVTVLVMREHPSLDKDFVQHAIGESIKMPEKVESTFKTFTPSGSISTSEELKAYCKKLSS